MKYHYQRGIVENDKKGHKKAWLAFFATTGIVSYGGFAFATLALNGWPLEPVDKTTALVKSVKPGSLGDHLFVPAINLSANFSNTLVQSGNPRYNNMQIKGSSLSFGATPGALRTASPFFNLDKLREGDEVFLDKDATRYVYRVTNSPERANKKLTLQTKDKSLVAEAIGTVAWHRGKAQLQPL